MKILAETDRGIIMFRNMVRQGIRAVQNGEDPMGVVREKGKVITTYCNCTAQRIPAAPTPDEDRKLLWETGRKWGEEYLGNRQSYGSEATSSGR